MLDVIELSKELIAMPSVTPKGADCIERIIPLLEEANFTIERIACGKAMNLWARYGKQQPLVCFLGHVDVVPPGPLDKWQSDPFSPDIRNGMLYGRGAADMKTGVAAMVIACLKFIKENPHFSGSLAIMLTTAEEAMDELGIPNVVEVLEKRQEKIDYCITAEPSSSNTLGDIIRNGRRGSLTANLCVKGKQGHIAYPHLADNPIHKVFAAFATLNETSWDNGNAAFPPTSLQFSNLHAGTGVGNVIPGEVHATFNFRFSPEVTANELMVRTEKVLQQYYLDYEIEWHLSGLPFYTTLGTLTDVATDVIKQHCDLTPTFSTAGGTSDARFIAPTGAQVIELGISNKTAHQIDECVKLDDLKQLPVLYYDILQRLLTTLDLLK